MAGHRSPLATSGDTFLKSARFRYEHQVEIAAPPEWVWKVLTGDALVRWAYLFTGLRWGSPPPIGVGSIREVTVLEVLTARERFLRREETKRFTHTVVEASLPGLRRAAEDWIIEPTPSGSRVTWTLAVEARPLVTPLVWAGSPLTRFLQRRVTRVIRSHAAA